jgi:NADH:ubiquinone oxidoreductase subunit F (NADH-binding)/NADH:ubiquinone oxidoreductase subunit E/Pyruvate/2-oxoacid:ferredoxin oxidoreductase delta subunit
MTPQLTEIQEILDRYPAEPASLIMALQDLQSAQQMITPEAVDAVAARLGLPRSRVHSAASFYKAFSIEKRGRHQVDVCTGTACHVKGAERVLDQLQDELAIEAGGTTPDGELSLDTVHCVGACALGPVALMDGKVQGDLTPRNLKRALKKCRSCDPGGNGTADALADPAAGLGRFPDLAAFRAHQAGLNASSRMDRLTLSICTGSGCRALGSEELIAAFQEALPPNSELHLQQNGCHGYCEQGLIVVMRPSGVFYRNVKPADAAEIVAAAAKDEVVERLLYRDPESGEAIVHEADIPFYARQERRLMATNSRIAPLDIDEAVADGAYEGLALALGSVEPASVIDRVKDAGLRGRGGGGFAAARKWSAARKAAGETKYILCNADEGDPGAFMDCALMEGNPHAVIEGMIIGAWAVAGGEAKAEGYVYLRAEYPVAVTHMEHALAQARARGLLGENILGTGFDYDIKISRGGGSFVCGESTALMASIEGKIGEPRAKYVHTSERGLWESPTVLNNVETWANVPLILREGAESWASLGTEGSKGTKIFSLVGKVVNTGLVEVPMGMSLREIVEGIGGGIPDGKAFKAVQTGGPSGGCVPADQLDLPVDFDALSKAGSMMGSGGMIVMDEDTCMVDVARYFTRFLAEESCGKCAACRLGLEQMEGILTRICAGEGRVEDLDNMSKLFDVLDDGSLCGLGKSAANPVRSTLTHFRDEYLAHIEEGRCPAGVCRALITYAIDDSCNGCTLCKAVCPVEAITGEAQERHFLDPELCDRCGLCVVTCPTQSIRTV